MVTSQLGIGLREEAKPFLSLSLSLASCGSYSKYLPLGNY